MSRVAQITRAVRRYDKELFAKKLREPFGSIGVYRKDKSGPSFVFALTENWTINAPPREWGIEPVIARLRAMDLWTVETAFDRFDRQEKKSEEQKERNRKHNVESFLHEFRGEFKKTFAGVNTSLMNKIDRRKRKEQWAS
jgi:hypothetical protein